MMEQEPVYVASDKLSQVCQEALGKIYDRRKTNSTDYIQARVQEYNQKITQYNNRAKWFKYLGVKPRDYITPFGMEQVVFGEMQVLQEQGSEFLQAHPMCQINGQYGDMEHMAKDAIIQCAMNESVLVSADMARCISHLGIPLTFCRKRTIGFLP